MIAADLALFVEDQTRVSYAENLAKKLNLPLVFECPENQIILALTRERLELRFPKENMNPMCVDFLDEAMKLRLAKSHGRSELIARAVGLKSNFIPSVIDATAGLAGDAMVLAHLGCKVTMLERSGVICALLQDGLERAQKSPPPWLANLNLLCGDAKKFFLNMILKKETVDVIYLDPMFPARIKSALVKKEMRIMKKIVGEDEDSAKLFDLAIQCAKKRVVVKRPRHASTLTNHIPSVVYKGKASRFDVYFPVFPAQVDDRDQ